MREGFKLIKRIEFHEIKGYNRIRAIETRFYVTNIKEFLKWCIENHGGYYEGRKFDEEMYDYELKRMKNWKKREHKFRIYICGNDVWVYPQDGYVAVRVAGLHYICQHSFDIIPQGREIFYGYKENEFVIGKLYSLPRRGQRLELNVTNKDILDGFMLRRETVDKYRDDFIRFIYHKRQKEKNK